MMPELLNYEECAKLFPGKNVRWVRDKLVARQLVDTLKVGRDRFVVRSSVVKYIASAVRPARVYREW